MKINSTYLLPTYTKLTFQLFSKCTSPYYEATNRGAKEIPGILYIHSPRSNDDPSSTKDRYECSQANDLMNFSSVRPLVSFPGGPVIGAPPAGSGYSRESTPDSGGSHYIDPYRDATGTLHFYTNLPLVN